MTPTPQEPAVPSAPETSVMGNSIVISGISGSYPESQFVKDLDQLLYNKENPVNTDNPRWQYNHPELPQHLGKMPGLEYFDAQFFKVHYRLGHNMDPMSRKLLEQSYQAIYDAGLSPEHLSGKKVGVYIGSCFSEAEKACFYEASSRTGFGIAGCSKAMFANRISYWLNAKGPSMSIDAACSSSMVALERAFEGISRGECEAAIVGGANICLHPQSSVHYGRIIKLCFDGKTRSFDAEADGCARSEAINVLFLQKAKDAKRIYGNLCYVKSKFDPLLDEKQKQVYGPYRDPVKLTSFMKDFYLEAGVDPSKVEYVEAYGSAVPEADKSELEAISRVFCDEGRAEARARPLLVGSVMSNIGYGEAASGISAITKVLLAYQKGQLAGNLHYSTPRNDVPALMDGRLKVLEDHHDFGRSFAAVNSLSVTGVNVHVLMHGYYKPKDVNRYKSDIPYLVTLSGRQESAVQKIIDDLKKRPIDPEEIALIHNIHEKSTTGHLGRGFCILDTKDGETACLVEKCDYSDAAQRPLWFVYSGMGSQWAGMGAQLMRIPIFAAAIQRCQTALEPKGINLVEIITSPEKTMFDNILHSFVGIAACQIGLTDVLFAMGIKPDKIIGHSVGELGCAYADGCFTAEEMILSAYSRGLVSLQTPFIKGSMAAVGLGYQQMKNQLPPEIEVACHNSSESCTISGPADVMKAFVAQLTEKGVFAKEVPCSNIAYHSRYIKEAGPGLLKLLSEVITDPKPRSDRWLSSSVPEDKWDTPLAKYSSAEYHTNNLLNSVLFEETSQHIPANAVLIEVAPHGLLQAILKRSLPSSCVNIPLTRRGHADNARVLLEAVGTLYMQGYNPVVRELYPRVEFPVSTGTPMLSHFIEWAHNEKWSLPLYVAAKRKVASESRFVVSVYDDDQKYLKGNVVNEEIQYPYSSVLMHAWDTLAMSLGLETRKVNVQFKEVHFHNQPIVREDKVLRFDVQISKGNGYFEVMEETIKIVSGYIIPEETESDVFKTPIVADAETCNVTSRDIYKMFYDRGSYYTGEFRSIQTANPQLSQAQIAWTSNWVTFVDGLVQLNALRQKSKSVSAPKYIQSLIIDVTEQAKSAELCEIDAEYDEVHDLTRCGGIAMVGIHFEEIPRVMPKPVGLKALDFVPYFQLNNTEVPEALNVFLQLVAENVNKEEVNVLEIVDSDKKFRIKEDLEKVADDIPGVKVNYQQVNIDTIGLQHLQSLKDADVVVTKHISTTNNLCELIYRTSRPNIFLLTTDSTATLPTSLSRPVASTSTPSGRLVLSRWRASASSAPTVSLTVHEPSDIAMMRSVGSTLGDNSMLVLAKYPPVYGLKELVQQWRKQGKKIYVAMINQRNSRDLELEQLPDFDLVFNILNDGSWGGEFFVKTKEIERVDRPLSLRIKKIGNLDSLHWEEVADPTDSEGITVKVHYAGLNALDAARATGSAVYDDTIKGYGMDFSGVNKNGERVMGVIANGAASSVVSALPSALWPVPTHWSMEDAATVPLPYAHAFYCLGIKTELFPSSSILIHGATGGLGQACLNIALAHGCKVFATVSDVKKKRFLRRMFPELPEKNIGNSRDHTFVDMVKEATDGKGVSIVISCLKNDLKNLAVDCCADFGITIDTHQVHSKEEYWFGMNYLRKGYYSKVDFSSVFLPENREELRRIQTMVSEGIARGYVRPLSRLVYGAELAPRALRLLAASRHRGRALLALAASGAVPATDVRLSLKPTSSHIVLDFTEDSSLTMGLIDTLVARGARNIFLHSDNLKEAYVMSKIRYWKEQGVQIKSSNENVLKVSIVTDIIRHAETMAPTEGVFVVNTGVLDKRRLQSLELVVSKFDNTTRKICPNIKFFTLITENGAISHDVFAGRKSDGLPGHLVMVPAVKKYEEYPAEVPSQELSLSPSEALAAVELSLSAPEPVVRAHTKPELEMSLIENIAHVAGVTISESTPKDTTLELLGIQSSRLHAAAAAIARLANVYLEPKDVPHVTVGRILEWQASVSASQPSEVRGLRALFPAVDPDEIKATTDIVIMPTLSHPAALRDDEFDSNETFLILIPGLDGHYSRFESFCERLKVPAMVLQYGLDHVHETPRQIAEKFAKIMIKRLSMKDNFVLLGYSFGSMVALELASVLEERGLEGTVFCVDAEPETYSQKLESFINTSGEEFQDMIVQHLYNLISGQTSKQLAQELQDTKSWNQKIEMGIKALRTNAKDNATLSADYARSLMDAAYSRIQVAKEYRPINLVEKPLRSQVVYIRSRDTEQNDQVSLSKYTQKPVKIYDVKADHARAMDDYRTVNIVNTNLEGKILEKFTKRNLCNTYLVNANQFMSRNEGFEAQA